MLKRLLFGFKGFGEAMAMQNPAKATAIIKRAQAGDAEAQRVCIDCYCDMSQMIAQTAMQALRAASSGGNADADGLLAESFRRGEATGKPDLETAMAMNIRSLDGGSYVGAVNLAEDYARQGDCRTALEYIGMAEQRLTEQVTNSEENSRKLVRFARKKIDHIKGFAIRQLGQ
ncbi:MAG TPA: hypothetical protein VK530_08245 [Candidatus Acidoferrum sp.]|nr:hypothetical protein [Candidatus Acidoferrum sp.]